MKVLVALFAAALLMGATWTSIAYSQTPTPTSAVPEGPSNVRLNIAEGTVTWDDNSNNEDGFRIVFSANDVEATYQAPANSESFPLPADRPDAPCGLFSAQVTAFNEDGDSPSETGRLNLECVAPTPTVIPVSAPTQPASAAPVLPDTGGHGGSGLPGVETALFAMMGLGLLAVMLGRLASRWR